METCNVMLALGGDRGNTVPKYGITVSEIAVLREIHGEEAVDEIEVVGELDRSNREELARLRGKYGHARPEGSDVSFVDTLFPGAAARVFASIDELELPDDLFKAEKRAVPAAKPAKAEKPAKAGKAVKSAAPAENATEQQQEIEDDGVGDMTDEHSEQTGEIFG